jgi:DNA-binding response OmpR family regulator
MGWNVVLATDNEAIQHLFSETFEAKTDVQLAFCQTAEEVTEEILKSSPDLLIISVSLPDREGYDLCKELKEQRHVQFPVLLIEDIFEDIDLERCVEVRTDGFIAKPFEEALIIEKVDEVLNAIGTSKGETAPQVSEMPETLIEEVESDLSRPEADASMMTVLPSEEENNGILELTDLISEDESASAFQKTAGFEEEVPPSIASALEESVSELEKMEAMEAPASEMVSKKSISETRPLAESGSRAEVEEIVREVVGDIVAKTLEEKLPQYLSASLSKLFAGFSQSSGK